MSALRVANLRAGYEGSDVVTGISLSVCGGDLIALLGVNGAGKSTLAKTIMGLIAARAGDIVLDATVITDWPVKARVAQGLVLVPEGRELFPSMKVEETLRLGALRRGRDTADTCLEMVFGLFPVLKERRNQHAGTLSGGEQQMLAIGRALMSDPQYLLLDEPSLGLAPILARQITDQLVELQGQGIGILLIEQNAALALRIASAGIVMNRGAVMMSGSADELLRRMVTDDAYLGSAR